MKTPRILAASLLACTLVSAAPPAAPKPAEAPAKKPAPAKKAPPPTASQLPAADRQELEAGVAKLAKEIDGLRESLKAKPELLAVLPDVQVYLNAVRYPLVYDEPVDVAKAKKLLTEGEARAKELAGGKAGWINESGVRGFVSRVDGSVQPYSFKVPASYRAGEKQPRRLDIFCHGRDETLTELKFLPVAKAGNSPGEQFHVDIYGRFCNATKFAGETDVLEVIEDVKKRYHVDDDRVVLTGFSMGGASVWHLTAHYADRFVATSPGAGFAETAVYQKLNIPDKLAEIPWYEQKLWHWYDATDYAVNFSNTHCIAYAGENDPQKQSGDIMEKALASKGIKLERIWGPNTAHAYEKEAKKDLDKRLDAYAAKGRDVVPTKVRFTTWTLRYDRMHWVRIEAMEHHWAEATVEAEITDAGINVKTQNVAILNLSFPKGRVPTAAGGKQLTVTIDGTPVRTGISDSGAGFSMTCTKINGKWANTVGDPPARAKRHGLTGPIDDAFLDSFAFVKPTGQAANTKAGSWSTSEFNRAVKEWHGVFRGEARVIADDKVTDADLAGHNLVLFGDPSSNKVLAKLADKLPIKWTKDSVTVGGKTYPADHHAVVMIYPNPLNPHKYIVLNSGFTFREGVKISNSRQTPRLPDYAVVDLNEAPSLAAPGKIVEAGFFGEGWELQPDGGRGQK